MSPDSSLGRFRRFVAIGVFGATAFSLFLIPSFLAYGNRPIPRVGLTPLQNLVVYYAGGVGGGTLVALLYPLRRWFLGAFILGAVALAPMYLGFALLIGRGIPTTVAWAIGCVLAYFVGGGLGTQIWSDEHGGSDKSTVIALWLVTVVCQVPGWYMGMRWPGETQAGIGLGLVFMPAYLAALATISRKRQNAPAAA